MNTSPSSTSIRASRNPLFAASSAFAFGIYLELTIAAGVLLPLLCAALLLGGLLFTARLQTAAILGLFVCCGHFASLAENYPSPKPSIERLYEQGWIASGDPVVLKGELTDSPRATVDGAIILLEASSVRYKKETISTHGSVRVFVAKRSDESARYCDSLKLRAGNSIRIALRLKREEPYRNPGTLNTIGSLGWRGLSASGSAKSCFLVSVMGRQTSLFATIYEIREWVTRKILDTHDRRTAGIVLASMVGNKNFLTKESGETFRENGTFHVLVISGIHITLIGGLILLFVRRVTSKRFPQFVIANTLLWSYAALVGLQLPVLRAAIMYSVFLLAYTLYRHNSSLNALSAAILVVLIWRPSDLVNPSFQLTCLSSFAIICFAIPLIGKLRSIGGWMPGPRMPFPPDVGRSLLVFAESLYWREKRWAEYRLRQTWKCKIHKTGAGLALADTVAQRLLRNVFELAFVSLSVQMFLLPLLVIRFHRISSASLISNIFAAAAVAVQNAAAIIAIFLHCADKEAARAFSHAAAAITNSALFIQNTISNELFASLRIPVYSDASSSVYAIYFVPLLILTGVSLRWDPFRMTPSKWGNRFVAKLAFIAFVTIAFLIILHPYSSPRPDGRLRVDFLDVGQGDAALVTYPDGKTMLIDGGGTRSFGDEAEPEPDLAGIGERVVSEYLWERGYSRVDYLVSTHPDADHINGLTDVIGNFDVERVFVAGVFRDVAEFQNLRSAASKKGIPIQLIRAGMEFSFAAARTRVLHPARGEITEGNDDSVVLRISLGTRSFLFAGDIEAGTESKLVRQNIESTIVKVPHHGSRTSSTKGFVDSVKAEYAVVPVGKRSPYGHPHKEVVERWLRSGAEVFKIGDTGTLTISTDGNDLELNGFITP